MDYHKIGQNIASLRKKVGLTQQELGERLYVTDKAVSKWERGLSLPDIAILESLADILNTDIYSILQIEKKKDMDIKQLLLEEKKKIKKQLFQRVSLIVLPILIVIGIILFKFIPFGYQIGHVRYSHNTNKLIDLGIPKYSFLIKNIEDSYSFKSFRSRVILKNEVKAYLNTLNKITCNDTIYYYDSFNDITFIDYQVRGNLLYNTVSYSVRNGNYCDTLQVEEYISKIGPLYKSRTLYAENSLLDIYLYPTLKEDDDLREWTIILYVYYNQKLLEHSTGTFEIKGDELIYDRTRIIEQDKELAIPNMSRFVIKDKKLILEENYLKQYENSIILK